MIGFTIRKAFFDLWDNLFTIILLNLGFILLAGIPVFVPHWVYPLHVGFSVAAFIAGGMLLFCYAGAVSLMCRDMTDYRRPGAAEFRIYLTEGLVPGLVFGLITMCLAGLLLVAFPFYGAMRNFLGLTAMVFIFWAAVLWILASLYFFPLRARLDRNIGKVVKKCFLLLFDNTGFTLFLGLGAVVMLSLSFFTAFLVPGPAALLLWLHGGFKLRLLKYDYREEHPGEEGKKIPWDLLLEDEREKVGPRTLKGMIFPWKD